eukprot:3512906-Amphidinium_carterae.1
MKRNQRKVRQSKSGESAHKFLTVAEQVTFKLLQGPQLSRHQCSQTQRHGLPTPEVQGRPKSGQSLGR